MKIIELMMQYLIWQFVHVLDLALQNWAITMVALGGAVYWSGKQRRLNRHHL